MHTGMCLCCFNTQPPEGGWSRSSLVLTRSAGFQHTAARRRLAKEKVFGRDSVYCFNTQPPEGGWTSTRKPGVYVEWFQHTAARRRLV